jgi:large subunit ribosomal protein L2
MGIKVYKPTTPGRRKSSVDDFSDVTKKNPEKSLLKILKPKSGRNNSGRITVRHKLVVPKILQTGDFKRNSFFGMEAEVKAIEYDPNRGPRIALVEYQNGKKSYILAAQGLKVGDKVISSNEKIEAKTGNRMPLEKIPVGLFIYNVELTPGKGGQLVRGAGNAAQLLGI